MRGTRGSGRATGHDVATEAGVSQATVARVFSSPDKVAEGTRTKVLAAADRLGYFPNAIARSLKAQRTDIIGAVVPGTGEYWQHVLTSFSRLLSEQHKQLLLFSFDELSQVEHVLASAAQYQVDGLILASANISPRQIVKVASTGVPIVAFNQPAAHDLVPTVTVDNELGMQQLAHHLAGRGAKTAVFVGGVRSASTDEIRYRGAVSALSDHGIACPYVEAGAFHYEAGYKIAQTLGDSGLPDAVMVGSDEVAFGVIDGLRERGVHTPRDVLITGFDGLPQAAWAGYDLTTLEQPTETLVEHAIEIVLGDEDDSSVVVPGTIRQGSTTDNA